MNAKEYLSGVYLDDQQFNKTEVIQLMEDYHKYKIKQNQQEDNSKNNEHFEVETIGVRQKIEANDPDVDTRDFSYEYNDYWVSVEMAGGKNHWKGVWIDVRHNDHEEGGFMVFVEVINRKLRLSFDAEGGATQTKKRTYREWIELERVESALKIIGNVLK